MTKKSIRKHFRADNSVIDYIFSDFSFNRIPDKKVFIVHIVNDRIYKLNIQYNEKLDQALNFVILYCRYDNLPVNSLLKIIKSLSNVTSVISKGFLSIIDDKFN